MMELIKFTDPALRKVPEIFDFENQNAQELADTLWEESRRLRGLGLSANQVGIDSKVFVMGSDETNRKDVFNPHVVSVSKETELAREGCLSYPGLWLSVKRPKEVTLSYQTVTGEYVVETFTGLPARIAQHEFDHMEGLNFSDHVSQLKLDMALKSLNKRARKYLKKYVKQNL
jgi:peptide deformylase